MTLEALSPAVTELGRGLRLGSLPMTTMHRVVLSAHLNIGSRFESKQQNGISHFLEHMLFRGIPSHPSAHEQALAFEQLGGTLVAATGCDSGTMSISVPAECFGKALPLFCEVLLHPIFNGIEVEKGIVKEEIYEDLDEHGQQVNGDNLLHALCFEGHPLAFPIVGTTEQLGRFDERLLERHHANHYTARNTVLAVAGPVDPDRVARAVEEHLAALEPGEVPSADPPPRQAGPRFCFVRHSASQTALRVGFRAPGVRDPLEPAIEIAMRLLDDGMSTRLYRRICDERGLCYDVSAGYESYDDSGLFYLSAETSHDTATEVLAELFSVVRTLRDEGPRQDELDRTKARFRWELEEMLDDPDEAAEFVGTELLLGSPLTPAGRAEQVSSLTVSDVRRAIDQLFVPSGLSVVAVGLQPKKTQHALEKLSREFD